MHNSTSATTVVRTEVEPCRVRLDIEVSAERTRGVYDQALAAVSQHARVPGFRPGKAPRTLLLRHYGPHIEKECLQRLVNESTKEVLQDQKPAPETVPQVENEDALTCVPGEPFVFSVSFDVPPQFNLPEYKGITVSRDSSAVEESQVDDVIENWLGERSSFEKVDRPSESGDLLKVTYEGTLVEAAELPETSRLYLSMADTWVPLRDPELIPGTAAGLVGLSPGESRELDVTFPADFADTHLAGRSAHYRFDVLEVHGVQKPELTDDLAKTVGAESVGEVRDRVRENLVAEKERNEERSIRQQILNALLNGLEIPLPPTRSRLFSYNRLMRLFDQELRSGSTPEQVSARHEELSKQANRDARRDLKRFYVLRRIAAAEQIEPDGARVNAIISVMAANSRVTPKVMVRRLEENGRLEELVTSVLEEQVLDKLVELANVVASDAEKE